MAEETEEQPTETTKGSLLLEIDHIKQRLADTVAHRESLLATIAKAKAPIEEGIQRMWTAFESSNADLLKQVETAVTTAAAAQDALRAKAIEFYELTGEKTADENVGVQVRTSYSYEQKDAVNWAKTNAPIMIVESIDKKTFESFKGITDLEFVEVETKVSAVLKGLEK